MKPPGIPDAGIRRIAQSKAVNDVLYGLADKEKLTVEDVDPEELEMGISVEMEHTTDPEVAKQIALDHLSEMPDYYTRLEEMEGE